MLEGARGMAKRTDAAKAVEGSAEHLRERVREAISTTGTVAGMFFVTDTFPDRVVVDRFAESADGESYDVTTWEVPFTDSGDSIELGEPRAMERVVTETLVEAGAKGRASGDVVVSKAGAATGFTVKGLNEAADELGGWDAWGVFSVFDYVDHSKDRMLSGVFADSLVERLPKIKDHHGVTVGQAVKATETADGLEVEFRIYPTRAGKDLATLMQPIETSHGPQAPVMEGSVGFSVPAGGATKNKFGGWDYSAVDLWEVSPVTFGDNDATRIGLKARGAVGDSPTAEALAFAAATALEAVHGPTGFAGLVSRRRAKGRTLSTEQVDAAEGFVLALAEAGATVGDLLAKRTRRTPTSTARARAVARVIEALSALVDGPDDGDGAPDAAEAATAAGDGGTGDGDAGTKGTNGAAEAGAGGDGTGGADGSGSAEAETGDGDGPEAEALKALDVQLMRATFERLARS